MEITQAVNALSALAQESRLEVFRLLVRCGDTGLPAGEIARELGLPPNTLTFHLKELLGAGLLTKRREGRSIIYSLQIEAMQSLLGYLMEDCCQGRPELCLPSSCCDDPQKTKKCKTRKAAKV